MSAKSKNPIQGLTVFITSFKVEQNYFQGRRTKIKTFTALSIKVVRGKEGSIKFYVIIYWSEKEHSVFKKKAIICKYHF